MLYYYVLVTHRYHLFGGRVSLYSPYWPGTCHVDKADFELTEFYLPLPCMCWNQRPPNLILLLIFFFFYRGNQGWEISRKKMCQKKKVPESLAIVLICVSKKMVDMENC